MIVTKVSDKALEIEWRPPVDDGGAHIMGYVIEMSEGGGTWRRVGYTGSRETKFTIAGLAEGMSYFFRVSAETQIGLSVPLQSDCVIPTKPMSEWWLFVCFHMWPPNTNWGISHRYRFWACNSFQESRILPPICWKSYVILELMLWHFELWEARQTKQREIVLNVVYLQTASPLSWHKEDAVHYTSLITFWIIKKDCLEPKHRTAHLAWLCPKMSCILPWNSNIDIVLASLGTL